MNNRQTVLACLDRLSISYELIEHEPVYSIDDCYKVPGIDFSRVEIPKNAALCNRQQTAFYLMLLRHDVPFRTAVVSKALGVSRLSFAPNDRLPELLGLTAGAVSPLGLLFDPEHRVTLVLDEGLRAWDRLAFHPCENTATVIMGMGDFIRFLEELGIAPIWVNPLPEDESMQQPDG